MSAAATVTTAPTAWLVSGSSSIGRLGYLAPCGTFCAPSTGHVRWSKCLRMNSKEVRLRVDQEVRWVKKGGKLEMATSVIVITWKP